MSFELLHPGIQEWVWDQQWSQLRSVQVQSIPHVLSGSSDVIVTAATAGGKTEAAWLPICSALARSNDDGTAKVGVKALCISPLKALINDQFERLRGMAEYVDVPVVRRHGDVTGAEREAIRRAADGIVLITPESLEALFVLQGTMISRWFDGLQYVVVDELHAFIGSERGAQLQSLLHRLELAVGRRVPRVALSATLADPRMAAEFLRPGGGGSAVIISGKSDEGAELRMQLRGYLAGGGEVKGSSGGSGEPDVSDDEESMSGQADHIAISEHMFANLRGKDNLIFANSRTNVELYADTLKALCDQQRLPNEFYPHHGNLARELREDVEARLKSAEFPTTAVCTSTLEMGVDIGSVDSIAQVGPPPSVASLRQRLGRSGRRGTPAVLRVYVSEEPLDSRSDLSDRLRSRLVQSIAMLNLMLGHWFEHPSTNSLHLSTLVQQVLSIIGQRGGATAQHLYTTLCQSGPFAHVSPATFQTFLRVLGARDILVQAGNGLLLPGAEGERILNHYSFYTAFHTPLDYRLITNGTTLGSLPIDFPLQVDDLLIFAGRRWKILEVSVENRVINLSPSAGGKPPKFSGSTASVADEVRQEMRRVLTSSDVPSYLDFTARGLLEQGRATYRDLGLAEQAIVSVGNEVVLIPWSGDLAMNSLKVWLSSLGYVLEQDRITITVKQVSQQGVRGQLQAMLSDEVDPVVLAASVPIKEEDKYDYLLDRSLLDMAYAARSLDIPAAKVAINRLLSSSFAS